MTTAESTTVFRQSAEDVFPRLQLALNVPDIEAAITFYNQLFNAEPAKVRPGYANYALSSPPLKLILFEHPDATERLNHLGVEVASPREVVAETRRLGESMPVRIEDGVDCCHALQDKVWVDGPGGATWEVYTVLADSPGAGAEATTMCCGDEASASCCQA